MKIRRTLSLVVPLALVITLASCEDDHATPAAGAGVTTTTDASGATGGATGTSAAPADTTSAPTLTPATDPPATAAAPPAGGASDASTGLVVGPPVSAPEGTTVNQTIKGEASITIDGPFPMSLSGGLCSFVDTTLYIQAGDVTGDFITLSFVTRDMSIEAITDTSTISDESLGWQAGPNKTAATLRDGLDIVFDGAGISGSFGGSAIIAGEGIQTGRIDVGGRFSCLPSPFQIRGAQGLNLTAARCNSADSYVSAGTASGDSALLSFDPASLSAGDRSTSGALSFRVGTVVYTSRWALAEIDPDGLGATFEALMVGPDGVEFLVDGGFSCL
ncbi:MAG: hypothetical protein RLZZ623_3669 [Actinomycetota bacterium]|jgi:hypothetical protein